MVRVERGLVCFRFVVLFFEFTRSRELNVFISFLVKFNSFFILLSERGR